MKASIRFVVLGLLALYAIPAVLSQSSSPQNTDPGISASGAIGEVKAIDSASHQVIVKTDAGSLVTVTLADNTTFLKLAPGETTLTNATKVTIADVAEGDRVFARGVPSADRKSVSSKVLIVMSKADIAKKQEAERLEWRRRGVLGVITSLNPSTKEITISSRAMGATQSIIIPVSEKVEMRRYAPDSIKFSDARNSKFEDLQVGDQLRALGEKNPDGTHFTAEKVVTGSFRTIAGTVTAIDASSGEIKINDLQTKQPMTIVIKRDAVLRKFPPMNEMAGMFMRGSGAPANGAASNSATGGAQPGSGQTPQGNRSPAEGAARQAGGAAGPGGRSGGGFNIQDMLERLPVITVADLKVGDTIIVSSTKGTDASRLTAISLVSGADTLLNMVAARQPQQGTQQSTPNPAAGLGSGIQFGIGLP